MRTPTKDMKENNKYQIIILGAGMAGLSAGITLKRAGFNTLILEKEKYPGGLFSSSAAGGCDFDFGPKILLLDKSPHKEEILSYLKGNFENYPVDESVYLSKYGLLPFPLQRHLIALPDEERERIIESLKRSQSHPKDSHSFEDWLINNYGEYFAKEILIPYEEKKWQISLNKMDYRWALKRPVRVNLSEVLRGSKERLPPDRSYYYPKKGNISELTKTMAKEAGEIIFNQEITSIEPDKKRIISKGGEYYYDYLISTIPIDYIVNSTEPISKEIKKESASKLKHLSIAVFNLVFKGNFNLKGTAIYFPEREFIFRRVSVLENLCPALKRKGETPISVEVSLSPDKKIDMDRLYKTILADLKKIGQFSEMGDPIYSDILKVGFAYPLQVRGHYNHIANIHRYYALRDIYHCGRGGSFEYYNGDQAYKHGVETALKMIKRINYKNNMLKKLTLTVGLPSYKSGPSIIETVKSIRASEGVDDFKIMISVDGPTMDKEIEQKLLEVEGVKIIHNQERQGQTARNKQIAELTETDLLIMTQDDVRFKPDAIKKIVKAFQDDFELTMAAPKIEPLPPETFFEKIIHTGTRIVYRVTKKWNKGDNYLASIGRCLAYRTEMVKGFEVDDKIINCDAYYYFENKRLAGNFRYLDNAIAYYRSPQNMADHLKQVRKFVVSEKELTKYTIMDLNNEYRMPRVAFLKVLFLEFLIHPILSISYAVVSIYARTQSKKFYKEVTRFWEVDASTKKL